MEKTFNSSTILQTRWEQLVSVFSHKSLEWLLIIIVSWCITCSCWRRVCTQRHASRTNRKDCCPCELTFSVCCPFLCNSCWHLDVSGALHCCWDIRSYSASGWDEGQQGDIGHFSVHLPEHCDKASCYLSSTHGTVVPLSSNHPSFLTRISSHRPCA